MLAILTTHPIQYQVPIWQALAKDGRVPFEVWYLTEFNTRASRDREFGKTFTWDIDVLSGYPYRFIETAPGATPVTPWKCRLREPLRERLRSSGARALMIQGWQVAAYWQAVREAKAAGVEVWLRAESNDLAPTLAWKRAIKRVLLGEFFKRVDRFLYIGAANRRLYREYGVPHSRLYPAPYAVDNERFAHQADALRPRRQDLRRAWGIADDAFCVLFCGKFIAKKRPMDLVEAAKNLLRDNNIRKIHLLFAGSGELGPALRAACRVVFDAEQPGGPVSQVKTAPDAVEARPSASFAGFLNQTEISSAYVAADCLVLPSDYGETWGLVVNEAMASGTPCIVSDACGCAEDMLPPPIEENSFALGDARALSDRIALLRNAVPPAAEMSQILAVHSFATTIQTLRELWDDQVGFKSAFKSGAEGPRR